MHVQELNSLSSLIIKINKEKLHALITRGPFTQSNDGESIVIVFFENNSIFISAA